MTVRELITKLQTFDPDMEVVRDRYSDLTWVRDVFEVEAIPQVAGTIEGEWLMTVYQSHKPTMSAKDIAAIRRYVYI